MVVSIPVVNIIKKLDLVAIATILRPRWRVPFPAASIWVCGYLLPELNSIFVSGTDRARCCRCELSKVP